MQQVKGRWLSSLVVIGITMAALCAPLSAFAETTAPAAPAPVLPSVPAPPGGAIKIGLGWGLTAADIAAAGGLYVAGSDGQLLAQIPAGKAVQLTLDAGQIAVAGVAQKLTAVRLVPVPSAAPAPAPTTAIPASLLPPGPTPPPPPPLAAPAKPGNPVNFKGKTYRGEIMAVVAPGTKKLSVVNVVNLEEYLLGVVPEEVEATWPQEAVKAQAVAARTYAVANMGKRAADGFDLVCTTGDQFYGGLASEKPLSNQAVMGTRGQVLAYGTPGKPISAMYHSSSGGHTENNEIIYFGNPKVPYLRGVQDFDLVAGNKLYSWEYQWDTVQFAGLLKSAGHDVGAVAAVAPVAATKGASGRFGQWVISGSSGSKTISGQQLRMALNLPSSPRSVQVQAGGMAPQVKTYTQAQTFFVMGAGGVVQQRAVTGTAAIAAGQASAVAVGTVTAMSANASQPAGVRVSGGGSGHAVGMSQWGAYGMALIGKTYSDILTHYYTGVRLETRQSQ
ncbi:MAG TPA: SpoIID/LytB domain-containing protein [Symbiobacteriaceae bacterium]|nr:SpoIID/LytB domain-containing protein [Symbiobacteriaceae bacterium]